ncbi:MAG TPA: hypothetical protein P5052_03450 [Candidatus Paceibacterota bacterium]|nr:hypothetical protein [Candidatus Paceibacterota bacterium]HRZ29783.1 hypothetical protein [Candidatus Paceibacterota bacterium]
MNIDILLSRRASAILEKFSVVDELESSLWLLAQDLHVSQLDPNNNAVITILEVFTNPHSEEIQVRVDYDPEKLALLANCNEEGTKQVWVDRIMQTVKDFLEDHSLDINVCCSFRPCPGMLFASTLNAK